MSKEKNFSSRIQHKHDIEFNWNKAVNFIPKDGEIIIYDADENYSYPRIKIGNGSSFLSDLHFIDEIKADKNIVNSKITSISFDESSEGAWYYSATVPNYILEEGNLILASFHVGANYGHGTYLKINDSDFIPVGADSDISGVPVNDYNADVGTALYMYHDKHFILLFSTCDKVQLTLLHYLFQNYYNKYGFVRVDEVLEQFQQEWTQALEQSQGVWSQAFLSIMGDDFPEDSENIPSIRQIAEDVVSSTDIELFHKTFDDNYYTDDKIIILQDNYGIIRIGEYEDINNIISVEIHTPEGPVIINDFTVDDTSQSNFTKTFTDNSGLFGVICNNVDGYQEIEPGLYLMVILQDGQPINKVSHLIYSKNVYYPYEINQYYIDNINREHGFMFLEDLKLKYNFSDSLSIGLKKISNYPCFNTKSRNLKIRFNTITINEHGIDNSKHEMQLDQSNIGIISDHVIGLYNFDIMKSPIMISVFTDTTITFEGMTVPVEKGTYSILMQEDLIESQGMMSLSYIDQLKGFDIIKQEINDELISDNIARKEYVDKMIEQQQNSIQIIVWEDDD